MNDRPIAGFLSGDWRRCILIQSALNYYQRAIPALFIGSSFHYRTATKEEAKRTNTLGFICFACLFQPYCSMFFFLSPLAPKLNIIAFRCLTFSDKIWFRPSFFLFLSPKLFWSKRPTAQRMWKSCLSVPSLDRFRLGVQTSWTPAEAKHENEFLHGNSACSSRERWTVGVVSHRLSKYCVVLIAKLFNFVLICQKHTLGTHSSIYRSRAWLQSARERSISEMNGNRSRKMVEWTARDGEKASIRWNRAKMRINNSRLNARLYASAPRSFNLNMKDAFRYRFLPMINKNNDWKLKTERGKS